MSDRFLDFLDHFYDNDGPYRRGDSSVTQSSIHTQWRGNSYADKFVVVLCNDGEKMRFKLNYADRELYDVAKQQFPHTDDEVHIPASFCNLTHGEPQFSPCVYQATTDYLQARWGRRLDDSDKHWLGRHPYATNGGIPREYTLTCVQQLLEPYGMGISRVRHRAGVALVPPSVFDWCISLGCNPFAMVDHQTTNAEAAAKLGIPLEDANKLWRFEFSEEPIPCSIIGEQGYQAPAGQHVNTGQRGGHARYLPPRGRFSDWFISCQLEALDRIAYDAPTPNPEYVPRLGDPMLLISNIVRPDGKPLAVKAKRNYSTIWVSPEEAAELSAAEAARTTTAPAPSTPQTPASEVKTTVVVPKNDERSDMMATLKLPRLYDARNKNKDAAEPWSSICPVNACRARHTFPKGMSMVYIGRHEALGLEEWLCKQCQMRFTTTMRMNQKEFKKFLRQVNKEPSGVAKQVARPRGVEQGTFPGWCGACAKVMDPDRISEGICDECWWDRNDAQRSEPAAAPTADSAEGPKSAGTLTCVGCGDVDLTKADFLDGMEFCKDCVALAFEGLVCGHEQCKHDLADFDHLPHFIGYDAESHSFSWACSKCGGELEFDDRSENLDYFAILVLSRVLALDAKADEATRHKVVTEWDQLRMLLEFEQEQEEETDLRPPSCGKCKLPLDTAHCETVQKEPDGAIIYACQNIVDSADNVCGGLMVSRPIAEVPLKNCPSCNVDMSEEKNKPHFRGVRDTGMQVFGCHLNVPYFTCNECGKSFLDMRGSSKPLTFNPGVTHAH